MNQADSAALAAPGDSAHRPAHRPWPLLAALSWLGVAAAVVMGGVAMVWPDDLAPCSDTRLIAHHTAFMATTFAYHAGLSMLAVAAFALLVRRRRLAFASLAAFGLAAGPELTLGLVRSSSPPVDAASTLTLMSANVMYGRADPERLLAEARAHQPDVILFQEWTPRAESAIRPLLTSEYPYWAADVREDAFGQAVCSRRPFVAEPRLYPPVKTVIPQITVEVSLQGRPLRITNIHTLSPVSYTNVREQRALVRDVARWLASRTNDPPNVLAGDFNAVSRSPVLAALRRAGMREAHRESGTIGRGSSWPRVGLLQHVPGIRLDHVLVDASVITSETRVCGDIGSDHAPVVTRLHWAAQAGR